MDKTTSSNNPHSLIVLGGSLTALGIIRSSDFNRLPSILVDTVSDLAFKSTLPCKKILLEENSSEAFLLDEILKLGNKQNYLIATSDAWLTFLARYREQIDRVYCNIWHPQNSDLMICLNKGCFHIWCLENDIETPYSVVSSCSEILRTDYPSDCFPAIVRPVSHGFNELGIVPKTIEIFNYAELQDVENLYKKVEHEFIISKSLLSGELIQYSVPFSRISGSLISFVALKRRPFPIQCGVGTYVELIDIPEINEFAVDAINCLDDYYGIGEVEILYSVSDKKKYLIEINARPWAQFSLSYAANYNFLGFLLGNNKEDCIGKKKGCRWVCFDSDLFNCFSRSVGLVRNGQLSFVKYLSSIFQSNEFPHFSVKDVRPFYHVLKNIFKLLRKSCRRRE